MKLKTTRLGIQDEVLRTFQPFVEKKWIQYLSLALLLLVLSILSGAIGLGLFESMILSAELKYISLSICGLLLPFSVFFLNKYYELIFEKERSVYLYAMHYLQQSASLNSTKKAQQTAQKAEKSLHDKQIAIAEVIKKSEIEIAKAKQAYKQQFAELGIDENDPQAYEKLKDILMKKKRHEYEVELETLALEKNLRGEKLQLELEEQYDRSQVYNFYEQKTLSDAIAHENKTNELKNMVENINLVRLEQKMDYESGKKAIESRYQGENNVKTSQDGE